MYPTSPTGVPENFMAVSGAYRLRVVLVLVSIVLFLCLYLGSLVGLPYLAYYLIVIDGGAIFGSDSDGMQIVFAAIAVLVSVFLLKVMFKSGGGGSSDYDELTELEHPKAYDFIRKLCAEVKAPFPRKIFISHDVNAAVFYKQSFWNLFFPARKNLVIGMGLINTLNLTEFKAVLAHEFGHFSQSSMKLGSYVYTANRIIHEMVYGRDSWDDFLEGMAELNWRIAIFVWILMGVIWVLKQIMKLFFQVINLAHATLSRQMEFHADLVAVNMAGSDAIVNALSKLNPAQEALEDALEHLSHAADQELYTRDVYFHQAQAVTYFQERNRAKGMGLEIGNSRGPELINNSENDVIPGMYDSHPSNYEREKNAKAVYVRGITDQRPALALFGRDAQDLRENLTKEIYEGYFDLDDYRNSAPDKVEEFIQEERSGSTFGDQYQGVYDDRYLSTVKEEEVPEIFAALKVGDKELLTARKSLYADYLPQQMREYREREGEIDVILPMLRGEKKSKDVIIAGKQFKANGLEKALVFAGEQMDEMSKKLEEFDRRSFAIHYKLAKAGGQLEEFKQRYNFQLLLQELLGLSGSALEKLDAILEDLSEEDELDASDINKYIRKLNAEIKHLATIAEKAREYDIPELSNMQNAGNLAAYLWNGPLVSEIKGKEISGEQISEFYEQLQGVLNKLRRLHFKNLKAFVDFQERLAESV